MVTLPHTPPTLFWCRPKWLTIPVNRRPRVTGRISPGRGRAAERDLPEPGPVDPRAGWRDTGPSARQQNSQSAGPDRAVHGGGDGDGLAVDTHRNGRGAGVDDDLAGRGVPGDAAVLRAAEQSDGLAGAGHPGGDDTEGALVQPGAPAQVQHPARAVGIVADQQ